jgi:hypothetical protein
VRQWQCPCGTWVDMSHTKHIHTVNPRQPTLQEMTAARAAGRDQEALAMVSDMQATHWSPDFPRRDKPNE